MCTMFKLVIDPYYEKGSEQLDMICSELQNCPWMMSQKYLRNKKV